jgi:hypothetical protein
MKHRLSQIIVTVGLIGFFMFVTGIFPGSPVWPSLTSPETMGWIIAIAIMGLLLWAGSNGSDGDDRD